MIKLIALGVGSVGAAATAMALFGTGIASAAPDVVGGTYADALSAIEEEGATAVVATRVGNRTSEDECIVSNATDSSFIRDVEGGFEQAEDEVLLALNCYGDVESTAPGYSAGSVQGREAISAAEEEEAAAAEEAASQGAEADPTGNDEEAG